MPTHREKILDILSREGKMQKTRLLEEVSGYPGGTGAARKALDALIKEGVVVVERVKKGSVTVKVCSMAEGVEIQSDEHSEHQKTETEPTEPEPETEKPVQNEEGEIIIERKDRKTVHLPASLMDFVSAIAEIEGMPLDDMVKRMVEDWLILHECSMNEPMVYGVRIVTMDRLSKVNGKGKGKKYTVKELGEFEELVNVMDLKEACRIAKTVIDSRKIPSLVLLTQKGYTVLVRAYDFLRDDILANIRLEKGAERDVEV